MSSDTPVIYEDELEWYVQLFKEGKATVPGSVWGLAAPADGGSAQLVMSWQGTNFPCKSLCGRRTWHRGLVLYVHIPNPRHTQEDQVCVKGEDVFVYGDTLAEALQEWVRQYRVMADNFTSFEIVGGQ